MSIRDIVYLVVIISGIAGTWATTTAGVTSNRSGIKELIDKYEADHDSIVTIQSDVKYIKEGMQEQKELIRRIFQRLGERD